MNSTKKLWILAICAATVLLSCKISASSSAPSKPTKGDYVGTWQGTGNDGSTVETVITGEKIWVTITDTNDDQTRPIDGAEYTVAADGTITVAGKDENGDNVEYKLSIDENGKLVIKDECGNEVANCGKISTTAAEPEPITPPEPQIPTKGDYVGTWKGTGNGNSTVETVITDEKIWVTITDTNGDQTRPIDGAEYTVAADGTITVAGKDENGDNVEYKLSIDENGKLVIKDEGGNEVASCGKTDTPATAPGPLKTKGGITLTFPAFTDMQDTITVDETTVTKGTKVTLTLPNTYASYQWWLDSEPISGATESSYEWDTTDASSGVHTIMCVVETSSGKTYSARVDVTVGGTFASYEVTAANVAAVILGLQGEGPHKVSVKGAISDATIDAIKGALNTNKAAKVNLDLSQTTGLESVKYQAFKSCDNLASVKIPNSVTSIGEEAFEYCSGLTSVEIPDSVTSIGNEAFYCCTGLTSVEIPASVKSIGEYAFCWSNLTSVKIPASVTRIERGVFDRCRKLVSVKIPENVTSIGSSAFRECSGLTSVEIPDSVTSIGVYAFSECSGLTSIKIPSSVTSIGYDAFSECSGLTSVEIGNSVTSIGSWAFNGCSGLTSVEIPASVKSIEFGVFSGCSGLTSISVDLNNQNYSSENGVLFNKDKTTIIQYPAGKDGTSYTIPNSVTSIGYEAFSGCSGLTSVEIPNSVTSIGYEAFYGCRGLTSVEIPDSVESICDRAFDGCSGLTSVEIPNSVTSIGKYAFDGCSGLTSVTFKNTTGWRRDGYEVDVTDPAQNVSYLVFSHYTWNRSN